MHKYKTIGWHFSAWILYLLILLLGSDHTDYNFWANTFATLIPVSILFYVNVYWLFPKYLSSRKFIPLVIFIVLFNLCAICLRLLVATLLQHKSFNNFTANIFSPVLFWNQFRVNLLFIGISFAYWFAKRNYQAERNQQLLEKEISDARLMSLKSQINPHFLYNTLSFLYTKSLNYSEELAGAIVRLSDMMRYSLAEVGTDGKVSLENEILHLQNFIEIHQLRFSNHLKICFEIEGPVDQWRIMPLLLITFVENAFKHGALNDPIHPLTIQLSATSDEFYFRIKNKKLKRSDQATGHLGLKNVKNRLQLIYPHKHELSIDDSTEMFSVNLKLYHNHD